MRKYTGIVPILIASILFSCSGSRTEECKQPAEWNFFKSLVEKEILSNKEKSMGVNRNIAEGEKVVNQVLDTVNWQEELKLFSEMFEQTSCFCQGMNVSGDSSSGLVIKEWTTTDTLCALQKVKLVTKNNKTELLEVTRRHRSWVVNRDVRLALQPGRGYSILLDEDYLWSKPGRKEIFANYLPGQ